MQANGEATHRWAVYVVMRLQANRIPMMDVGDIIFDPLTGKVHLRGSTQACIVNLFAQKCAFMWHTLKALFIVLQSIFASVKMYKLR